MTLPAGRAKVPLLTAAALAVLAGPAQAYVGPGAGFVLVTSFLVLFSALALAFFYLATWPLRLLLQTLRRRPRSRVRRLVVLGLDGLDAGLCAAMMEEGRLPNLAGLEFRPLATTRPAMSPVAWSTFQTGLDPSYHGIFDFIRPARPGYGAELSSVVAAPPRRCLRLGRWRLPLGRSRLRLRRRGEPFWRILGKRGVFSAVIRVPLTFPPEKHGGLSLSGMCVPDLRGTQGTFTHFTSAVTVAGPVGEEEGGRRLPLREEKGRFRAFLEGPPHPLVPGAPPLRVELTLVPDRGGEGALLVVGGRKHRLRRGVYTGWIRVTYRAALVLRIRGLVRFLLLSTRPHLELYASPVHLDPERPAMPISHPPSYALYLARRLGPFATLGLAEETGALAAGVLGAREFLAGTWAIQAEREGMFFDALDRVRRGLVACVFDAPDRIQHMFTGAGEEGKGEDPVAEMYGRMDELVGRTRARLAEGDELLVLSDHGFTRFRRGVNLNAWLARRGWLHRVEGADGDSPWFAGVDWERTRAFALGLAGIYLNRRGRYRRGLVEPGEAAALKAEIAAALLALRDPAAAGVRPVLSAADPEGLYDGPYRDEAPDLLVGFAAGYRASWEGARGVTAGPVFRDNDRAWSGDHCVDPALVPGVLFSTLPLGVDRPALADLAPSILDLFGLEAPARMKGRKLFEEAAR